MQFREAFTYAKQMEREFRAFNMIAEVLDCASKAEKAAREAETRKVGLEAEAAELGETCTKLRASSQECEDELQENKSKAEAYRLEKIKELKVFLADLETEKEAVVRAVRAEVDASYMEAAEKEKEIAAGVAKLEAAKEVAEKALAAAQSAFAAVRKKVEGLG